MFDKSNLIIILILYQITNILDLKYETLKLKNITITF